MTPLEKGLLRWSGQALDSAGLAPLLENAFRKSIDKGASPGLPFCFTVGLRHAPRNPCPRFGARPACHDLDTPGLALPGRGVAASVADVQDGKYECTVLANHLEATRFEVQKSSSAVGELERLAQQHGSFGGTALSQRNGRPQRVARNHRTPSVFVRAFSKTLPRRPRWCF